MTYDPILLLRDPPVDDMRLAEIRRRVLTKVAAQRPGPGRWILAGGVASCLLAAFLWPQRLALDPPVVAWSAPQPPAWAFAPGPRTRLDHRLPPVARSREVEPQPQPEITVVAVHEDTATLQIPTSNPDVVLYWLVDGGGD